MGESGGGICFVVLRNATTKSG